MTEQSVRLLVFAVRRRVVLKYLGVLLLSMAPMAAVPVLVALHGEAYESANRFALVALLLLIVGGGLARIAAPQKIQINEALVVTALAFLIAAASMVWPLMAVDRENPSHQPYAAWLSPRPPLDRSSSSSSCCGTPRGSCG